MVKRITSIVLSVIIVFMFYSNTTYGAQGNINPSREVLEKMIEEIAHNKGIPSVILKSIARVESIYQQYRLDGSVFRGSSGEIGLMQIYNRSGYYDSNRLKYDIEYNIEVSADILLQKWANYGRVGNMDPNILENWYFALWAYNGWSSVNNPNTGKKPQAYQESVYMIAEKDYGQKITSIDTNLLPKTGKPSKDIHVPTPEVNHIGDIPTYNEGDFVVVDSNNSLTLRNSPSGISVGDLVNGEQLEIIEGPVLKDGFLWYKLKTMDGSLEGWTVCNWITKIGSKYPFDDIGGLWAKEYIISLYEKEIINGNGNGHFNPNDNINRQEMSVLLTRTLKLDDLDYELPYDDASSISDWALDSVKAVSKAGIMKDNNDENLFNPYDNLTREEIAVIVANVLDKYLIEDEEQLDHQDNVLDEVIDESDSQMSSKETEEYTPPVPLEQMMYEAIGFRDASIISWWALDSVKVAKQEGIIEGTDDIFNPKDNVKRGEVSKVLVKILDRLYQQESTD